MKNKLVATFLILAMILAMAGCSLAEIGGGTENSKVKSDTVVVVTSAPKHTETETRGPAATATPEPLVVKVKACNNPQYAFEGVFWAVGKSIHYFDGETPIVSFIRMAEWQFTATLQMGRSLRKARLQSIWGL